jgi:lipopolysaccharide/colanic/teichoic acid biosynthesis glycosyltransferase
VQLAARYPARYRGVFQHRPGITGPVQVQLRDLDVPSWAASDAEQYYIQALVPSRVALDLGYLLDPSLRRTVGLLRDTAMHVVRRGRSARPAKPAKPVLQAAARPEVVGRWQSAVLSDALVMPDVESRVP